MRHRPQSSEVQKKQRGGSVLIHDPQAQDTLPDHRDEPVVKSCVHRRGHAVLSRGREERGIRAAALGEGLGPSSPPRIKTTESCANSMFVCAKYCYV